LRNAIIPMDRYYQTIASETPPSVSMTTFTLQPSTPASEGRRIAAFAFFFRIGAWSH
jgi:hypothetical protein